MGDSELSLLKLWSVQLPPLLAQVKSSKTVRALSAVPSNGSVCIFIGTFEEAWLVADSEFDQTSAGRSPLTSRLGATSLSFRPKGALSSTGQLPGMGLLGIRVFSPWHKLGDFVNLPPARKIGSIDFAEYRVRRGIV